jgi:hypothetical protein
MPLPVAIDFGWTVGATASTTQGSHEEAHGMARKHGQEAAYLFLHNWAQVGPRPAVTPFCRWSPVSLQGGHDGENWKPGGRPAIRVNDRLGYAKETGQPPAMPWFRVSERRSR